MPTCEEIANTVGQRSLWCGTDTVTWSIAQFVAAAQFARSHGLDTLFLKAGEGYFWYGGVPGIQAITTAVHAQGVGVVWYIYSDGGKALQADITMLQTLIRTFGVVCADIEKEWSGEPGWATAVCNAMKPEKGLFLVSTFGNPDQQNLRSVLLDLSPCVDAYMPQQYSTYLSTTWGQFAADGAACLIPTVDLSQEFAPNDPISVTRAAYSEGHKGISFWYLGFAQSLTAVLSACLAAFPERATPTPTAQGAPTMTEQEAVTKYNSDPHIKAALDATWNSIERLFPGITAPRMNTSIHDSWVYAQLAHNYHFGPPITEEMQSVDWSGSPVTVQECLRARAEFKNGVTKWYGANGPITL
ncbi:MAG TPA: hypothetical protein VH593_03690 [Ktedonobacteraceae bacterium]